MNEQFVFNVLLTADGKQLVGQVKTSKEEHDRLTQSVKGTSAELGRLDAAQSKAATSARTEAAAVKENRAAIDGQAAAARRADAATDAHTAAINRNAAAARQQRGAYTQLGFQIQDISQQLSLGVNPLVVLAQQGGQTAAAVSGMGGVVGTVGRFIAGPWGSLILAGVTTLGFLAAEFLQTRDSAQAASEGLDAFQKHQSDIGNFIDATTGKLKEQNRTLVQNAILTRQAAIGKNNSAIVEKRDAAFAAARGLLGDTTPIFTAGGVTQRQVDPELKAAIEQAGVSVIELDRRLQELGRRRPDLKPLIQEVSDLAGSAVLAARENEKLSGEIDQLSGKTTAAAQASASLVEKQVALLTATTPLGKARARYNLVVTEGAAAEKAGGAALEAYRVKLTAAAEDVNEAEAAERAANLERTAGAKALRGLTQETAFYDRALRNLEKRYDPLAASAREYREELERIDALQRRGDISPDRALGFKLDSFMRQKDEARDAEQERLSKLVGDVPEGSLVGLDQGVGGSIERGVNAGFDAFDQRGLESIEAFGLALGGKAGDVMQTVAGVLGGLQSGNFTAAGGRLSGILTLLGGGQPGATGGLFSSILTPMQDAFTGALKPVRELLGSVLQPSPADIRAADAGLFRFNVQGVQALGQAAGGAAAGAAVSQVTKMIGLPSSTTGGAIGGAIGSFVPIPGGEILGALAGSLIGGLLKGTPRGSATITGIDSDVSTRGNSGKREDAARELAGAVQQGIAQIAEALGGTVGRFAVSVGIRNDDFRLDRSGRGITKTRNGAIDFDQDRKGLISAAIMDAIADGGIGGLSAAVQKALASSTDVEKAVDEALKVKGLEELLGGVFGAASNAFKQFEAQAAERVRIARQYGFDLVEVERINAEQRADIFKAQMEGAVGGLQRLLDSFKFGDRAGGSLLDQRQALLDEAASLTDKAKTDPKAAQRLAEVFERLDQVSFQAFGSAGQAGVDRANIQSTAERLVADTEARLREEQKTAQDAAAGKLDTTNDLLDEVNDNLAAIRAALEAERGGRPGGLGSSVGIGRASRLGGGSGIGGGAGGGGGFDFFTRPNQV